MDSNKSITTNFGQDTSNSDADGLLNYQEFVTYGTNPNQKDSNTDSIEEGQAIALGYSPTFNFSALIDNLQSHSPLRASDCLTFLAFFSLCLMGTSGSF